ncbi:MAG: hypothetical protein E6J34_15205 [Chloroflexi bacterium]|nr:MAG: hypothetical protein E6J34_15205 [Chloroflexota bacterium]
MKQLTDHNTLAQQIDPVLVQQALALLEPAQRIALLAHEHPDGDCLGSALGLSHILRAIGKTCVPICADPAPQTMMFLPGAEMLQTTLGDEQFDLVIALDAGELPRFGPLYQRHQSFLDRVPKLNIDHHISSLGCGPVNIICSCLSAYRHDHRYRIIPIHQYYSAHAASQCRTPTSRGCTRNDRQAHFSYASHRSSAPPGSRGHSGADLVCWSPDLVICNK